MLRVNELFSGIGSQKAALENIGMPHRVVGICEKDERALQSYEVLHGKALNYGDITKVQKLGAADVWTYSFPCQSISNNGRREGFRKGSGTTSSLLWEVERLLDVAIADGEAPAYLVMENVKNLVSKKFIGDFNYWQERLEKRGYINYWTVTNALEHGSPQKRERVIMVSILKERARGFSFIKREKTKKRLADCLDGAEMVPRSVEPRILMEKIPVVVRVRKHEVDRPSLVEVLRTARKQKGLSTKEIAKRLEKPITCVEHWFRKDKCGSVPDEDVWLGLKELLGVATDSFDESILTYEEREGVFEQSNRVYDASGVAPTVTTNCSNMRIRVGREIRGISAREAWRLMGFKDSQIDKVEGVVPESCLYRQAGNSIAVGVMEDVFRAVWENEKRGDIHNDNSKRAI